MRYLLCLLLVGCASNPLPAPRVAAPDVTPVEITLPLADLRACIAEREAQARANRQQATKADDWKAYAERLERWLGIGVGNEAGE